MDSVELSLTPEEWSPIYLKFVENNRKAERLHQVFHKLLDTPSGISGPDLAQQLKPAVKEGTVRQFIRPLRKALHKLFFSGACISESFVIEIAGDPYKIIFWPREALRDRALKQRLDKYAPSSKAKATLDQWVAIADWEGGSLFQEFLEEATSDPNEEHDIRIQTSAFSHRHKDPLSILGLLTGPLKRGIKLSILMINPRNVPLVEARFRLRDDLELDRTRLDDTPSKKAIRDLYEQIEWLSERLTKFNLKVKLTNTMPPGFVAVNSQRALMGFFLARTSATDAPHISAKRGSRLWTTLEKDWKDRWDSFEAIDLASFKTREQFWGGGSPSAGKVIVQADQIEKLATWAGVKSEDVALQNIKQNPSGRLYKARTWVNKWDIEAANAICAQFQKEGSPAPSVVQAARTDLNVIGHDAPFVLSLGLGFTDQTTGPVENRCNWMRVRSTSKWGDALFLHKNLLSEPVRKHIVQLKLELRHDDSDPELTDFEGLFPTGWELGRWLGEDRFKSPDYAMIFRYSLAVASGTRFNISVGGYSDRATAIGGRYLAAHWKELQDLVQAIQGVRGRGEFLAVIRGLSNPDPNEIGNWSRVEDALIIVPEQVEAAGLSWYRD